MSASGQRIPSTQSLIKELCRQMCPGIDEAGLARMSKAAISALCSFDPTSSLSDNDEFAVVERIKKHFQSQGRDAMALRFDTLHRRLITLSHHKMQNRSAVLMLFLRLSEAECSSNGNVELGRTISQPSFDSLTIPRSRTTSESTKRSPSFRGPPALSKQTSVETMNWSNGLPRENTVSMNVNTERRHNRSSSERPDTFVRPMSVTSQTSPRTSRTATGKYEVSEMKIIRELLFCFQGIEGEVLRLDSNNGFKINPLAIVPQPHMVKSLMEMGYLHNCVVSWCQQLEEGGNVARGLTTAIRAQLTDYYSTVAELHSNLKQTQSMSQVDDSPLSEESMVQGTQTGLTLRRLHVWMHEPRWKFQVLADLCRVCAGECGGAVISAAYLYSYHGSLQAQKLATTLLAAAARPLFTLMCHWIIQGELYDPYDEFFVGVNKMCLSRNRWNDKFFIRKALVPAVMTEKQAMMVLSAGRCINFLNEICKNKMEVTGARAKLRSLHSAEEGEFLELAEPSSPLAIIIEAACREASQLVLETLKTQFKLFDNFHGLRRYMLMGQGDFYRYLIQLLEPELNKNFDQVYRHTLMGILDTAIRSTNCQFEDKEILSRLGVNIFEASQGETGWDIFTMLYNTSGPLDTVFQLGDGTYQAMFLFLWQLKRVEYSLSNFRKEQTCVLKKLQARQDFGELRTMLNTCSLMTAEMVHYINQVLYYILFEVVECAFESFKDKFTVATTIEEVIRDHELFLQEIKTKTLKDDSETSKSLSRVMTSLNLAILNLVSYGGQFLQQAETELIRRLDRDRRVEAEGTNYEEEAYHHKIMETFNIKILHATKEIQTICQSYKASLKMLKKCIGIPGD